MGYRGRRMDMDRMMVSPQTGELRARKATRLWGDENMEETAASPWLSVLAARRACAPGFIQKGEKKLKRYKTESSLHHIGWLALVPIRLAAGIACLLILNANVALTMMYILMAGVCTALLILRCRGVRIAYIGAAALGLALCAAKLPDSVIYLVAQVTVEAALVPALYRSRRIKDTFSGCARRVAVAVDGWRSRERDCSCYDVHFTTCRWTR